MNLHLRFMYAGGQIRQDGMSRAPVPRRMFGSFSQLHRKRRMRPWTRKIIRRARTETQEPILQRQIVAPPDIAARYHTEHEGVEAACRAKQRQRRGPGAFHLSLLFCCYRIQGASEFVVESRFRSRYDTLDAAIGLLSVRFVHSSNRQAPS